jgi:thiol-disulfide isomerase/thioredoxin
MSNKMYYKALILFSLLFCLWGTTSSGMSSIPLGKDKTAEEGRLIQAEESASKVPAPDFTLEDLSGKRVMLSEYRGKLVFLHFWASWCPPCKKELSSIQRLYEESDRKKFVILAVNIREDKRAVEDFVQKKGFTFPVQLDSKSRVSRKFRVRSIPVTFIINQEGDVIGTISGSREWEWDEFEPLLR